MRKLTKITMRRIELILLIILTVNFSCVESDSKLNETLSYFSQKLLDSNLDQIKNITTEKGFESLMKWSDSLKNKEFLKTLSENLKNGGNGVFNKKEMDSLIILSLGKSDPVLGATNGYLILKKTEKGLSIEEFRGGK